MTRAPKTASTRRHPRATTKRPRSELAGPVREVIYIFERAGARDGAFWLLVLECGHIVTRRRHVARSWTAIAQTLFEPIEKRLAPRHVQCHYCGSGCEKHDPAIFIRALGGEVP